MRALGDLGITSVHGFADPVAAKLLPVRAAVVHRVARLLVAAGATSALRRRFAPIMDILTMRTLAIDEALAEALGSPLAPAIDQLVILGAGLDARAFRLHGLAHVDVFEVDHPATQAYKRARSSTHSPLARSLRFVAVDFERERLDDRLLFAGHDPGRRSAWIWEGVIVYLSDAALRTTLHSVAALSPPGSRLLAQYREPLPEDDPVQRRLLATVRRRGEPQIGMRSRATMRLELERVGFRTISDEGAAEWAVRFSGNPPAAIARPIRVIVGERTESQ